MRQGMEIERVKLHPGNTHQGPHLQFVRTGGSWYAMDDRCYEGGNAYLTAQFDNCVFRLREIDDEEGTHLFLCHVYQDGRWMLVPNENSLAARDDFDLTYAQLVDY